MKTMKPGCQELVKIQFSLANSVRSGRGKGGKRPATRFGREERKRRLQRNRQTPKKKLRQGKSVRKEKNEGRYREEHPPVKRCSTVKA